MAEKKSATAKEAPKKVDAMSDLDEMGMIGHAIPVLLGVLALIAAVFSYRAKIQVTLPISLFVVGALLPALTWLSILERSRAAWSFLISLAIVLGVMTLFGAPKVRNLVGIHMGIALVIPAALFFAAFALSLQGDRYKNQG
jgi:hypothetical protein